MRNLVKYFPQDVAGLCNKLHVKATGGPPGHGSAEVPVKHALTASMLGHDGPTGRRALVAAQNLLDKQPQLGQWTWAAALAPIGQPTGEPRRARVFEPGALYHRVLPLPLDWRERQNVGHTGALTVGRILGLTYGQDDQGQEYCWGWGDFLDEDVIPDSAKARYLAQQGVVRPSLDPGGPIAATVNPDNGAEHMTKFGIGGATLVPIAAFANPMLAMHVFQGDEDWPDDDPDMMPPSDEDCGCDGPIQVSGPKPEPKAIGSKLSDQSSNVYAVNPNGWRGLPLAPREATFDNDDAILRIAAWANGGQDTDKMAKAFLWRDDTGNPHDTTSYRLPVGDIINGNLTLVYHAIYAASALIAGAHGGLPNVSDQDVAKIRETISAIYAEMAQAFNDSSLRAPWDRSAQEGVQLAMDQFAAAQEPYGNVTYADPGYRDGKKRYPIDTPEHIRAAWSYINQKANGAEYSDSQLKQIKQRIAAAAKKAGIQISDNDGDEAAPMASKPTPNQEYSASGLPIFPPKAWFEDPKLTKKTKLTVTPEGHVYGHLAAWNECHRDTSNRECVLAPHSEQDYRPFHLGSVYTAEGDVVDTGKIVMDTRHASINLGYAAAALHYDNTGDEIAAVRCGEDQFGIWFSGAIVPEATPARINKLRRSPLSGDWRREGGSLELTAALAVNAPAFPVYAMEDDERQALVAAGSVWFEDDDTPPSSVALELASAIEVAVDTVFSSADDDERAVLAERLQDILEDDEIYRGRERKVRLHHVFAADQAAAAAAAAPAAPAAPMPAPAAAAPPPAAAPTGADPNATAPADQSGQSATDAAGTDLGAWQAAAENDTQYQVIRQPNAAQGQMG